MKLKLIPLLFSCVVLAQNDAQMLDKIYRKSLTDGASYQWLHHLSNKIGSRLSGSAGAEKAIKYTYEELQKIGLDSVYLQQVMVPKWVRGNKEVAYISIKNKKIKVPICALGSSVATPKNGLLAPIIEVKSIEELQNLGTESVKGKIIFFNRPMNPELIETSKSYRGCVDQRSSGAKEAGKLGALGVIVRSMTLREDDYPHTGNTNYGDLPDNLKIPAAAISTNAANLLSNYLKNEKKVQFYFKQNCQNFEPVLSYNVIGEIKGSENPKQIMLVGGHLDSWDLGDGTHDDGAGVVQSMQAIQILKKLNYQPKNTLRVVLFMNEENGNNGGITYENNSKQKQENHIFALESDAGGFTPRGFALEADEANFQQIISWKPLFEPYLIHYFYKGGAGVDIGPLTSSKIVKAGLQPDSQRYFDYHHTAIDTFDAVNKRELELGAATMTSLLYLIDQYGIK